jgi:hypothetical protein
MNQTMKIGLLAIFIAAGSYAPASAFGVVTYEDLHNISGATGEAVELAAPKVGGTFAYSTIDPYGAGDDGGIVIRGANGWWIRQFAHNLTDPIQLDWFQVQDGQSVSALMVMLAKRYAPRLYIRMPTSPMTLVHDSGTLDWSSDLGLSEFALLESEMPTAIRILNSDAQVAWRFSDMSVLIIGSQTVKKDRSQYNFTLIGPWKWDNRGQTDSLSYAPSVGMVTVMQETKHGADILLRFNSAYPLSCSIYIGGNGSRTVRIAGNHRYGGCVSSGGQYDGVMHFDDVYVSDELGRAVGWTGDTLGTVNRSYGHWRGSISTQVALGILSASDVQVTGKITAQYGGAGFGFFFVDKLGAEENDPLVVTTMDYGWTGPNELGKPAGIALKLPSAMVHPIKSDGLGQEIPDQRFVHVIEKNQWSRNPNWPARLWFAENAQCDDVPNCGGTLTTRTTWTYTNARGTHEYLNGTHVDDRISHNIIQGDGVNPASLAGVVQLISNDELRYGLFYSAIVSKLIDNGPPFFAPGSGNQIHDVTLAGNLTFASDVGDNAANNVTFIGVAREVMKINSGASVSAVNLCAPSGSSVGGAGTLLLNGVRRELPYFLRAEDCLQANAEIPANPLFARTSITSPQGLTIVE